MEASLEKKFKIKVKKGYVLHIEGDAYQEGEFLTVLMSQIEDQLWKINFVKPVEEQPVDEKETPAIDLTPKVEEKLVDGSKDVTYKKPVTTRRLLKQKK